MSSHMAWWQKPAARVAEQIATVGGAPDERGPRPFVGVETPSTSETATHSRPGAIGRWPTLGSLARGRVIDAFRALAPDQLVQADGGTEGVKRYFAAPSLSHLRMHRENIERRLNETQPTPAG